MLRLLSLDPGRDWHRARSRVVGMLAGRSDTRSASALLNRTRSSGQGHCQRAACDCIMTVLDVVQRHDALDLGRLVRRVESRLLLGLFSRSLARGPGFQLARDALQVVRHLRVSLEEE